MSDLEMAEKNLSMAVKYKMISWFDYFKYMRELYEMDRN